MYIDKMFKLYSSVICVLLASGLTYEHDIKRAAVPAFEQGVVVGNVASPDISEASGLAASRKHPGYLYTHNDHGNGPEIYVISATNGHREATLNIQGATSNDWEDIAIGPCRPGVSDYCVYIGDTGDGGDGALNNVFRFPEPDNIQDQNIVVTSADKLEFSWGEIDCETLMVDPDTNVYIVSKVDGDSHMAKLPSSAWGTNVRVAVPSPSIINIKSHRKDPVGGDISPDGNEVLIKAKDNIFYWNAVGTRDYIALLTTPGTPVPYIKEHQGESVCWDATGKGYYTLGEGHNEPLYYYARDSTGTFLGR